ncbi:hypothetical protein G6O69_05170 [Pseudenhygromyxa sp. WMMC2535]|uniref:hypothetical protein n=1 Tax=Pseudenhygromyxa sp. WMMC2535 TaxID=2712867 RepID=UPI001595C22E|nr:hypothetical protein [Pseudenhygromyxa sp. WMMC2535]NVB37211.1 hypothetical protein [Pseudenhygromyxa sp. WMMC2535]
MLRLRSTSRARALRPLALALGLGLPLAWAPPAAAAEPPARDPEARLNFLSAEEYERVAQTEPIRVPIQVVISSDASTRLANACAKLDDLGARDWEVGVSVDLPYVLSDSGRSDLFDRLQQLNDDSTDAEVLAAASELAGLGTQLAGLCDHIAGLSGGLTADDVVHLRGIFADGAVRLTQLVEVLDKTAEELLDVLTAAPASFEQAKLAFVKEVDLGEPGTPQSIGTLSSLGEAASTAFEGLAQFLIDRAKEEAITYVRDQLSEAICTADPGLFIPRTCEVLASTDPSMSLSGIGASLNAALVADLEWMPDRLLALTSVRAPASAHAATMLRVMLALTRDAREHGGPLDFLVSLHEIDEIDCERSHAQLSAGEVSADAKIAAADRSCAETMAMLRLSSALSHAIVSQNRDLNDVYKSLGVAFGVERHVNDIPLPVREHLAEMIPELGWTEDAQLRFEPVHLRQLHRIIADSVALVQTLQDRIDALSSSYDRSPTTEDVLDTAAVAAVGLASIGLDIIDLLEKVRAERGADQASAAAPEGSTRTQAGAALLASPRPLADQAALLALAADMGDTTETAAADTDAADTAAAVDPSLAILRALLEDASDLYSVARDLSDRDWSQATMSLFELLDDLIREHAPAGAEGDSARTLDSQLDKLRRYLPMFIEVANAKSSDEVAAALEAAFPAGGYQLKYRQGVVAINAMLGAYGGGLYGAGLQSDGTTSQGLVNGEFALFAPIGVHLTGPVGVHRKRPWHLGAMISVIDIGGITTSKWSLEDSLTQDTSEGGSEETVLGEPSNFNFAGIVAPGAYFTIGAAKSPFVFGLGASYSPFAQQLSVTTYDSNGDETDSISSYVGALRFGAFVAVDITLVGFGLRGKGGRAQP